MSGNEWVRYTGERYLVPGMISVGKDLDDTHIVVGRASHCGDILPAKVKLENAVAYVCHAGREYRIRDFEVLMSREAMRDFGWVRAQNGHVPENAVKAGKTVEGKILYVGLAYQNGAPCVGKVPRNDGVLYAPFNDEEITFKDYEVLVQN